MKYAVQIQYDEYFENAIKCAKNAGFQYVSVGFGSSNCFHNPDWKKDVIRIDKILKENSIECIQTHLPCYDLRISSDIIDEAMDTAMIRCIEAGGTLGSKWNVYHARSAINDNYSPKKSMEYAKIAVENLLGTAIKYKSGIAIENLPIWPTWGQARFFTSNYEDLCELNDYFDNEYVSVCWDFGHANLLENNQVKALEYMGDRIKCTHVHNNDGKEDLHGLPSQGNIDWETIMPAFVKSGYDGALTLELVYKSNSLLESFFKHAFDCLSYLDEVSKK